MNSRKAVALASLLFTYLFFFEYLPPVRWVHIPFDLEGFHYPLADYAFQSFRQGRFPLWDPTIYCGIGFVSNVQATLFYPPAWLMYLFSIGRERLSYQALQDLLIAHVWLGFFLCYLWLRGKRLGELPCILGAGVFAFSGYMCTQLQHFGLVAGYVWIPLALWGIDQAVERQSWRPFWKVATASALCFLAGYPPTWMAFAVAVGVYALASSWRWKASAGTLVSLIFSLVLCAIQILPAWEVNSLRDPELRFGEGIQHWDMILSYVLPNYFNFGLRVPVETNPTKDYFYLGVPVLLGLPFLFRRRFRDLAPSLAVLAATLLIAGNPFEIVWMAIRHSRLLPDIVRAWYFLGGVTLAFASLTAYALDNFLGGTRRIPTWLAPVSLSAIAAWAGYELLRWKHQTLSAGWSSGLFLLVSLAIFGAGMYAFRAAKRGRQRIYMAVALVVLVGVDYKAFGTSKRINAAAGLASKYSSASFIGMRDDVYQQLRSDNTFRIIVDNDTGPGPDILRHIGLITPQGFEPMLTRELRKIVDANGTFRTDRLFDIDFDNDAALHLLGVKYVISSEFSRVYPKLKDNPRYRLLGTEPTFFRVYEYLDAQPPYSWEESSDKAEIERRDSTPESRMFKVRSASAGKMALHEQFFPGWTAWVDGDPAVAEPWMGAFQAVAVPAGEHTVEFRYHSRLGGLGRAISLFALIGLVYWIRANSRSKSGTAYRAVSG